jgi:hypothetical protein
VRLELVAEGVLVAATVLLRLADLYDTLLALPRPTIPKC